MNFFNHKFISSILSFCILFNLTVISAHADEINLNGLASIQGKIHLNKIKSGLLKHIHKVGSVKAKKELSKIYRLTTQLKNARKNKSRPTFNTN